MIASAGKKSRQRQLQATAGDKTLSDDLSDTYPMDASDTSPVSDGIRWIFYVCSRTHTSHIKLSCDRRCMYFWSVNGLGSNYDPDNIRLHPIRIRSGYLADTVSAGGQYTYPLADTIGYGSYRILQGECGPYKKKERAMSKERDTATGVRSRLKQCRGVRHLGFDTRTRHIVLV
jgi:hypothetical protein